MIRLGILGSTRGSHLLTLITAIQHKQLSAEISLVVSNKADALILTKAKEHHLPAKFVDPAYKTREQYDQQLSLLFREANVDLIVLIGYMRILSADFVTAWQHHIMNVHPSLLPAFAGKMDLDVHRAVLAAGVRETGCTVHHVTEVVDGGAIILQKKCVVLPTDTPEQLKHRVQQLEGVALVEAIKGWWK